MIEEAAARPLGRPDARFGLANEMMRGFSHALQNRLAGIGAVAQLVESGGDRVAPVMARMLSEEADRLAALASGMHLLCWDDDPPELVDLHEFAEETAEAHRYHHASRDLRYAVSGADRPVVRMHRSALRYVLLVLITGAARVATAPHLERAVISIDVGREGSAARLEIQGRGGENERGPEDARQAASVILDGWGGGEGAVYALSGGYALELPAE